MDGISPWPLLKGECHQHRQRLFSGLNRWRMGIEGDHKLVLHQDGRRECFNLAKDPFEGENLEAHQMDELEAAILSEMPFVD